MTHYKGKFYAWDVVNEAFDSNGALNNSIYYEKLGVSYITDAFQLTRQLDPEAKLYINDYFVDGINAKSDGLYNFVKQMRAQGVPIDGVGFQGHFFVGEVPADLVQNLKRFIDLGIEIAFTELDVAITGPADDSALEQQAKDYASIFEACQGLDKCVGVTVWGWCDRLSYNVSNKPDIWDEDMKPKPALDAIKHVLKGN